MFGRILCKLGKHKFFSSRRMLVSVSQCERCGKRKQEK